MRNQQKTPSASPFKQLVRSIEKVESTSEDLSVVVQIFDIDGTLMASDGRNRVHMQANLKQKVEAVEDWEDYYFKIQEARLEVSLDKNTQLCFTLSGKECELLEEAPDDFVAKENPYYLSLELGQERTEQLKENIIEHDLELQEPGNKRIIKELENSETEKMFQELKDGNINHQTNIFEEIPSEGSLRTPFKEINLSILNFDWKDEVLPNEGGPISTVNLKPEEWLGFQDSTSKNPQNSSFPTSGIICESLEDFIGKVRKPIRKPRLEDNLSNALNSNPNIKKRFPSTNNNNNTSKNSSNFNNRLSRIFPKPNHQDYSTLKRVKKPPNKVNQEELDELEELWVKKVIADNSKPDSSVGDVQREKSLAQPQKTNFNTGFVLGSQDNLS